MKKLSVLEYYQAHFAELSPEKQFHFATRLKNYSGSTDFDEYLSNHRPDTDLAALLNRAASTTVANYPERQPFFQAYPDLYGVEAALFRVLHLLQEYQIDLRPQFEQLYSSAKLHRLSDQLLNDPAAVFTLSSFAVNTICLTELLFPREQDVFSTLAALTPPTNFAPNLLIYYYTHIVICDTSFYTRPVPNRHHLLYRSLLAQISDLLKQYYADISLDIKLEYLVCCNLLQFKSPLRSEIATECQTILAKHPYLVDATRPARLNTLDGAEHRNVLFIMSGLDTPQN